MTAQHIYDAWAPASSEWSQWVKPVLFAHLPVTFDASPDAVVAVVDHSLAERLPRSDGATALVLDLPGALGVQMAGPLVERGYRPVPLYNSFPPRLPFGGSGPSESLATGLSSPSAPPSGVRRSTFCRSSRRSRRMPHSFVVCVFRRRHCRPSCSIATAEWARWDSFPSRARSTIDRSVCRPTFLRPTFFSPEESAEYCWRSSRRWAGGRPLSHIGAMAAGRHHHPGDSMGGG